MRAPNMAGAGSQAGGERERMDSGAAPEEVQCLLRLQQAPSLIQRRTLTQQPH